MSGPLTGMEVVEIAGLGPAPFCGMLLSDLGAQVTRVDRADRVVGGHTSATRNDLLNRGKRSVGVNLKDPDGVEVVLQLARQSEALIEGFRPGVAERLGIGPTECLDANPALVYGRMTGWGQEGPLANSAGHDIDYIALSGVLHAVGTKESPVAPLNLVGDFGGGGMLLALGVTSAVLHARSSGEGQIVDAAMTDGSALLAAMQFGMLNEGTWADEREANLLDGGAPFYGVYGTADGRHVAVGALEPQFFQELLEGLDLDPSSLPAQSDRDGWPQLREALASRFALRTRDEWAEHFAGSDACVAPVLSLLEAPHHPHNAFRSTFSSTNGIEPAPAPRFSVTPPTLTEGPAAPGADTDRVLALLGYNEREISKLRASGAVA